MKDFNCSKSINILSYFDELSNNGYVNSYSDVMFKSMSILIIQQSGLPYAVHSPFIFDERSYTVLI